MLELCERKADARGYGSDLPGAVLVAFAWDRKACRISVKRYGDCGWNRRPSGPMI